MNPEPEAIQVLFGADDRYAMPLGVCIYSLLHNLRRQHPIRLTIIDGGIQPPNKERIARIVRRYPEAEIEWRIPGAVVDGLTRKAHLSAATYYRFMAPTVMQGPRALYLDCDLLVQGDLTNLWNVDIGSYDLAAVQDFSQQTLRTITNFAEQGLDGSAPYFNAGVLLLNLDRWRSSDLSHRIIQNRQAAGGEYRFDDQDALNATVSNWLPLESKWNFQIPSFGATSQGPRPEDGIIHFVTATKPWTRDGYDRYRRPYNLWYRYLMRSGWFSPAENVRYLSRVALARLRRRTTGAF